MNQQTTILNHLHRKGSISPMEAMVVHGIHRLAARICDLKDAGHDIVSDTKRDVNGKVYAEYRLGDTVTQ